MNKLDSSTLGDDFSIETCLGVDHRRGNNMLLSIAFISCRNKKEAHQFKLNLQDKQR